MLSLLLAAVLAGPAPAASDALDAPGPPRAAAIELEVEHGQAQEIDSHGFPHVVDFDTVVADLHGIWDQERQAARLGPGLWEANASLTFSMDPRGSRIGLLVAGPRLALDSRPAAPDAVTTVNPSRVFRVPDGQVWFLTVQAAQTSGDRLEIASSPVRAYLWVRRLR